MGIKAPTEKESLQKVEERAAERLADTGLADQELTPDELLEEEPQAPVPALRLGLAVGFPTLAAAVMAGGVFTALSARFWAVVAAAVGIAIAIYVHRLRSPLMVNALIAAGLFFTGILLTLPAGDINDVFNVSSHVKEAAQSGDVNRPPVDFTFGWRAILGWLMGSLGFVAAWVAIELRRPAIGILVPLPVIAIAAISVPKEAQVASGLSSLVLFVIGLGILSGTSVEGDQEKRSLSFELRRAARAFPMLTVITVALFFLAKSNFLFPPPLYDPSQEAKKPRTVPLTEVADRVLFTVDSSVTGPWRMGGLDVYDGEDWRLPPFAENRLGDVPETGIVDSELSQGVAATFVVKDLGGAVLPGLPNLVGIKAAGPRLAYDRRTGNIRLAQGTIQPGLKYTVTAAEIPTIEVLRQVSFDRAIPKGLRKFLEVPEPPPAVEDMLTKISPDTPVWDKLDFMRNQLLNNVVSEGAGTPVSVTPAKVQDMLAGSKRGTPFEIVAGQAMLARWAGIPSRIGYGYDRGEDAGGLLDVRPKHGATFLEVYFPGYKWLPVVGTPKQAASNLSSEFQQNDPSVAASDDVSVRVFVPVATDPSSFLFEQIKAFLLVTAPLVILLLVAYYSWPALRKAVRRARRRSWAFHEGAMERIAVAYADWRDVATDFGYLYPGDTPLMFLDRVVEDEEHTELAWLVTRNLWGDLSGQSTIDDAVAAEELSGSLRKRLSQGHQGTLRTIAAVSRLSIRNSYAPRLGEAVAAKGKMDEPAQAA